MHNKPQIDQDVIVEFCNVYHNTKCVAVSKIISVWESCKQGQNFISCTARISAKQTMIIERQLCKINGCRCVKISAAAYIPIYNVTASIIQRAAAGNPMLILWDIILPPCDPQHVLGGGVKK